jgi:hypothetical protein
MPVLLRWMERTRGPLVPGGNTTRYQRLDISTGWCRPVLKGPPLVTSKEKYLPFNHNCCVGEMVREVHTRQEVTGSNLGHRTHAYLA